MNNCIFFNLPIRSVRTGTLSYLLTHNTHANTFPVHEWTNELRREGGSGACPGRGREQDWNLGGENRARPQTARCWLSLTLLLARGQPLSHPALHCGSPHFLLLPFIDCELLGGGRSVSVLSQHLLPPSTCQAQRRQLAEKALLKNEPQSLRRWHLRITPFPINQLSFCYKS